MVCGGEFTGFIVNKVPLHMVALCAAITAFGFTVTVTVKGVPRQTPPKGVTV